MIFRANLLRVRTDEARVEVEAETMAEAVRLAKEHAEQDEAFWVPLSVEILGPEDGA